MSAMATVLVVDDEPIVREVVVRYLEREGHTTLEAATATARAALLERSEPDLVVLDVMLPGTDGLELCRWIRSRSDLPVILLTARGEEADRIVGLELGADDYVTKPFSPRELAARVRTVLRRSAPPSRAARGSRSATSSSTRDAARCASDGAELKLTAKEFDLLWFLASNPRQVFSRDQLMSRVWGYEAALDTGTVTVHMRRLREKIEDEPVAPAPPRRRSGASATGSSDDRLRAPRRGGHARRRPRRSRSRCGGCRPSGSSSPGSRSSPCCCRSAPSLLSGVVDVRHRATT